MPSLPRVSRNEHKLDCLRVCQRGQPANSNFTDCGVAVEEPGHPLVAAFAGKDFRVVPEQSLRKIPRHEPVHDASLIDRIELDAARDETEAFQLVVIPNGQALEDVRVEAAPLAGPGGKLDLGWNRVGYVKTAPPSYPVEYVGWWPDPLLPPGPFDVPADARQPLWFRVDVPPDAESGHLGVDRGQWHDYA